MVLKNYIVLDIETTGLSRFYHDIIEISAVKYQNHKEIDSFSTLINPSKHIPSFISDLTGIYDDMVKDKPLIDEIIYNFYKFLENYVVIGHNITFDYNFLDYNLKKHYNINLENPRLCTLKLSRRVVSKINSYKLSSLCEFFNIENKDAHRAMSDVKATQTLFYKLNEIIKKNNFLNPTDLFKIEKMRIGEYSFNNCN